MHATLQRAYTFAVRQIVKRRCTVLDDAALHHGIDLLRVRVDEFRSLLLNEIEHDAADRGHRFAHVFAQIEHEADVRMR
ncbi:MAG TPA: hypothetical protein VNE00_15140 [Paraburkholderia sp.]|nr:hypothetical protein [Paraburkholderia sp.]